MTTKHAPQGEMFELRVRVTPEVYYKIKRMPMKDGDGRPVSTAVYAGQLLTKSIENERYVEAVRKANAREVARRAAEAESQTKKPEGPVALHDRSIELLVEGGFSISAIAAIKRRPYAEIAVLVGAYADAIYRRAREDEGELVT